MWLGLPTAASRKWWSMQQAIARRDMRRVIKELFEHADDDRSGILEKDEFARLVEKANQNVGLPALFSAACAAVLPCRLRLPALPRSSRGAAMHALELTHSLVRRMTGRPV